MEDHQIVELFWSRSEAAIAETDRKYGALCRQIAMNVLHSAEDAEECVSDAYLGVWNAIPPQRPAVFPALLCRFARNLALKRYERANAAKRGGSHPLPSSSASAPTLRRKKPRFPHNQNKDEQPRKHPRLFV